MGKTKIGVVLLSCLLLLFGACSSNDSEGGGSQSAGTCEEACNKGVTDCGASNFVGGVSECVGYCNSLSNSSDATLTQNAVISCVQGNSCDADTMDNCFGTGTPDGSG